MTNDTLQQAIAEGTFHLLGVFMNMHYPAIVVNRQQTIIMVNHAARSLFGYAENDTIIGKPLDILLPPEYRDKHREHINQFADGDEQARHMNKRQPIIGLRKDDKRFEARATIQKSDDTMMVILQPMED